MKASWPYRTIRLTPHEAFMGPYGPFGLARWSLHGVVCTLDPDPEHSSLRPSTTVLRIYERAQNPVQDAFCIFPTTVRQCDVRQIHMLSSRSPQGLPALG
jgi:hypothetical protein